MTNYPRMYRFGITSWERYGAAAAASIATRLNREENAPAHSAGLSTWAVAGASTPPI